MDSEKKQKKRFKGLAKLEKKAKKSKHKNAYQEPSYPKKPSNVIRFAEAVKGVIYLILSVSLLMAIVLGQQGIIITLDDIISNLFLARSGKILLVIIAIALFIYGGKQLRIIK